jgi:hypothetical protein
MLRRSLFVLFLIAPPGVVIFISPAARTSVLASAPNQAIRTRQAWTVNTLASDHMPVVADLEIGGS